MSAKRTFSKLGVESNPRTAWELSFLEATYLLAQRQPEESLHEIDKAIDIARRCGDEGMLARSHLVRYDIRDHLNHLPEAIQDLQTAEQHLSQFEPLHLLGIRQNLVAFHVRLGEFKEAAMVLPRAQKLCDALGHPIIHNQLLWLAGRIHLGQDRPALAEKAWKDALSGFAEVGDLNVMAELGLELALLYHQQGRVDEVLDLVTTRVIPALKALGIYSEQLTALELLQEAAASKGLSQTLLQRAHDMIHHTRYNSARTALLD